MRGLPVQDGCVHVLCPPTLCRVEAVGPQLPRFVRDRDGQVWSRFDSTWYLYDGAKILDVNTWWWLRNEHGPLVAVDALGNVDLGLELVTA